MPAKGSKGQATDADTNEFTFDLRRIVLTEAGVGEAFVPSKEDNCNVCSGFFGIGVLLTASYYDAYRRMLKAFGCPSLMAAIDGFEIFMRVVGFLMSVVVGALAASEARQIAGLTRLSIMYLMVLYISILLYLLERLAGRTRISSPKEYRWEDYVDSFAMSFVDRRPYAGPLSTLLGLLFNIAFMGVVATAALLATAELNNTRDPLSLSLVCVLFACELLYTVARLGRFKAITEQSWVAYYAACMHTLFITSFSFPMGVIYIIVCSTQAYGVDLVLDE
jgi:hypothetical protein